jgi:hypothetical protein
MDGIAGLSLRTLVELNVRKKAPLISDAGDQSNIVCAILTNQVPRLVEACFVIDCEREKRKQ